MVQGKTREIRDFSAGPAGPRLRFPGGFRLVPVAGRAARKCLPEFLRGPLSDHPGAAEGLDSFHPARLDLPAEIVGRTAGKRGRPFGSHQRRVCENHRIHAPNIVRASELVQLNHAPARRWGQTIGRKIRASRESCPVSGTGFAVCQWRGQESSCATNKPNAIRPTG